MSGNRLLLIAACSTLLLFAAAASSEETVGTLTLDGLSFISFEDDVSTIPTIATIRPPLGHILLPPEADASIPAAAGFDPHFDPIDKHLVQLDYDLVG